MILADLIDIWLKENGFNLERLGPHSWDKNQAAKWVRPGRSPVLSCGSKRVCIWGDNWAERKTWTRLNASDPEFFGKLHQILIRITSRSGK